jgi:hypothetical protein
VIVNHTRPDALDCGHGGAPVFLDPGNARSVHDAISRPTASPLDIDAQIADLISASDGDLRTILFRLQSDFGPLSYCAQSGGGARIAPENGRPEEVQCCDGAVQESLNTVRVKGKGMRGGNDGSGAREIESGKKR